MAVIDEASDSVVVYHGRFVECNDDWFIEGIWDDSFEKGNFDETDLVFGSGMRAGPDGLIFVSSSSMGDKLVYASHENSFFISNSIPCLLSLTDIQLDPRYDYSRFFHSLKMNLENHKVILPTKNGGISMLFYDNLLYRSGNVYTKNKPARNRFNDYSSLTDMLEGAFSRFRDNWTSSKRKWQVSSFSSLSTGYDSTVISCLASKAGCDTAFTCISSNRFGPRWLRPLSGKMDDDGTDIGRYIGCDCIKFDKYDYKKDLSNEIYLFAGLPNTRANNFLPVFNYLDRLNSPSLLFTGIGGDNAWDKKPPVSPGSAVDDVLALSEIRLKTGFIHCPMLLWLARFRNSLMSISDSENMRKWSVGDVYDRPVPRRIIEDRGVPRSLFGNIKKGSWTEIPVFNKPCDKGLRKQYYDYLVRFGICSRFQTGFLFPLISFVFSVFTIIRLILWKLRGSRGSFNVLAKPFGKVECTPFQWAVSLIAKKYKKSFKNTNI